MAVRSSAAACGAAALLAGCRGSQNALDPAGRQAQLIADHWWFFLVVCTAVWIAVAVALAWTLFRKRRGNDERRATLVVSISAGATVIIVFILLVHAVWTGRSLGALPSRNVLTIEIIGHRWWWQIDYKAGDTTYMRTANEFHIPVGEPVRIDLKSRDVIHSFWVPRLHGKTDMIPGHTNSILIQADEPGVFRGQCAEFCGLQHAHMGMVVVAQPRADYDRWMAGQRAPAREPLTDEQRRGREVFVSSQCMVCHTIRGTTAFGNTGPELTHLASRRTIAAATVANTRGALGGWILDPHSIKPGVLMPQSHFDSEEFNALLSYLESLQ